MTFQVIIVLILVAIAAASNSIMDSILFRKLGEGYYWWDAKTSHKNKWKNGDKRQGERFKFSSTLFVFTTDAWHFFQMLMFNSLFGIIFVLIPYSFWWKLASVAASRIIFGITFELTFANRFWHKFFKGE